MYLTIYMWQPLSLLFIIPCFSFFSTVSASGNGHKKSHFKQFMHLVPNPQKRQVLFKLYYVFHLLKTCFTILMFSFSHLKVQHGCFIFTIPGGNFEMKIGPGRAQESWMLASTIIWNTSEQHCHWRTSLDVKSDGQTRDRANS